MGHIRLGQLPRTRRWADVIDALGTGDVAEAGPAIARAADTKLAQLGADPGVAYLYWLLTRLTWHARSDDYLGALRADGIELGDRIDGLLFLGKVRQAAESGLRERAMLNGLSFIALRAFNEAVARGVQEHAHTLFGVSGEDVQRGFKELSTERTFARLARSFFTALTGGLLQFISSKESSNHVGTTRAFLDPAAAVEFESTLRAYAHQCTRILEDFSGEWYSKHNWIGDVNESQSSKFVAYAFQKLRSELKASGGAT
jgi:hypothetical protein